MYNLKKKKPPCPGIGIVSHRFTVSIKFASECSNETLLRHCDLCDITRGQVYMCFCFKLTLFGMWAKQT